MSVLLVTTDYRILVDANDHPVWLPFEAVAPERYQEALATHTTTHVAVRATETDLDTWGNTTGMAWKTLRSHLQEPHVAAAVAQLKFRENYRFHPTTGEPLEHPGGRALGSGKQVFPRIDPAVIGLVELDGADKILLGRNRLRPDYFSLIAGYVGLGESLETAWAREVLEETGRHVHHIEYWGSQPWPSSGSLMVAFRGRTTDEHPTQQTDSELLEVLWASRDDLSHVPLAAPGSIARTLIDAWREEI